MSGLSNIMIQQAALEFEQVFMLVMVLYGVAVIIGVAWKLKHDFRERQRIAEIMVGFEGRRAEDRKTKRRKNSAMETCTLCKEKIEIYAFDAPAESSMSAITAVSPATLRRGKIHTSCYRESVEESKTMPSSDQNYESRYEQWLNIEEPEK